MAKVNFRPVHFIEHKWSYLPCAHKHHELNLGKNIYRLKIDAIK